MTIKNTVVWGLSALLLACSGADQKPKPEASWQREAKFRTFLNLSMAEPLDSARYVLDTLLDFYKDDSTAMRFPIRIRRSAMTNFICRFWRRLSHRRFTIPRKKCGPATSWRWRKRIGSGSRRRILPTHWLTGTAAPCTISTHRSLWSISTIRIVMPAKSSGR